MIAARFGTTPQAIMEANGLPGSVIYPGQFLAIPVGASGGQSSASAGRTPSAVESCALGTLYVVRQGDSLDALAARWGVSVAAIKRANGLVSQTIWTGQSLRMTCAPRAATEASSAPASANINAAPACSGSYVVRPGDSLSAIAAKCGISVAALKSANGLVSNTLLVGQSLRLPAVDASFRVR
jgi:LysM repeat protein